jgi:hypothetical protein
MKISGWDWNLRAQSIPHILLRMASMTGDPVDNESQHSIPCKIMKTLERLTLATAATATAACAGYLIQHAIRTRTERLYRLAAGESPYERTHPRQRVSKKA